MDSDLGLCGLRPKRDEWQESDELPAIIAAALIMPSEQPTQSTSNNRREEPIAVFIPFDHCHCFFFTEKTVRCDEML